MTLEIKFALFQLVILVPFLLGSVLKRWIPHLEQLAKRFILVNLTLLEPPILFWSIMGLAMSMELIVLPVYGFAMALTGFVIGWVVMRIAPLETRSAKVYVICSSISNQGFTLGGFLCFLFAGEKGLALAGIFLIFFIPFTFLFIFGYAAFEKQQQMMNGAFVRSFLINPRNLPLLAILLAVGLRMGGVERPDVHFPLDVLLISAIAIYYFTLGVNFNVADLNPFRLEHGLLAVQKFLVMPALTFLSLFLLPLSADIELIIKIQSFMPVAIYAVISAIIFDLDARKASRIFVINSLLFILLVFPILFFSRYLIF